MLNINTISAAVTAVATVVAPFVAYWLEKRSIQNRFARAKPITKPKPRKTKGVVTYLPSRFALRFIECAAIVEILFFLYDIRNSFHLLPRMTKSDLFYAMLLAVAFVEMILVFFLMEHSIRHGKFRRLS